MKSTAQKLAQVGGLIDTKDVNEWENEFLSSVCSKEATTLTEKQVEVLERIYKKHFA